MELTMPDQPPDLLDRGQVARMLTVSESTVDNLVARGELPQPMKIGGNARWKKDDVDKYLEFADWRRKCRRPAETGEEDSQLEAKDSQPKPKSSQSGPK